MGRIQKVATERHTATASPFVIQFVQEASSVPVYELPAKLDGFPLDWPFPRGDIYHWIPLLDRFDNLLDLFNQEYGLDKGPQQVPFECRLLQKGDATDGSKAIEVEKLRTMGYSTEGDRELVESILHFTRVLLEHCGNRSLYASSGRLNDILHTCSLSLLRLCLRLSLRLAQRYEAARYKNHHPHAQAALLANHYNFNMDRLHKISQPMAKPPHSMGLPLTKEKERSSDIFNPCDLVKLAKESRTVISKFGLNDVALTYYESSGPASKNEAARSTADTMPITPTPARRTSVLGPSRERASTQDRVGQSSDTNSTPVKSREPDESTPATRKMFKIPSGRVASAPSWELLRDSLHQVPESSAYDMLNKVRIAKALSEDESQKLLEVRLLAICNLAYALPDPKFQERVGTPDAEEPKQFHLAQQLCDILQPPTDDQEAVSLELETAAVFTLEALSKSRHKAQEVTDALQITHNHGVLYYEVRKAIASLHGEEHADARLERAETEWREATFDLTNALLQSHNLARQGERMVGAGLMGILVEALSLRTDRAERFHEKILQFFDSFIHGITTAFQTLADIKGLDILADLASYEVSSSESHAKNGTGLPSRYKSRVTDYDIPFYRQSTLRQLFKFMVHMFEHNAGTHDRLLRNLIDTPQVLGALRTVIDNANVFGSNVWSGAVNIVSSFIHNEPTSFQVVSEAGLVQSLLETIVPWKIETDDEQASKLEDMAIALEYTNGDLNFPNVSGILPANDTMCDIPAAFGAICLNEAGMKLFQSSKALFKFMDIFVSPVHVRALEEDGHAASAIGQAFDELSRHHPQLKDQIMWTVIAMVRRVCEVCNYFAKHKCVGAKLWNRTASGLSVSGGRDALAGGSSQSCGGPTNSTVPVMLSDVGEDDKACASGVPFITACFKFLEGFLHNTNACSLFCEQGGAAYLLDLATSASNPHDLVAFPVFTRITLVMKTMCDAKPHLILPSIIRRTQTALEELRPIVANRNSNGVFAPFTDLSGGHSSPDFDGTTVVKSLAMTHILTHILGRAFAPPSYSGRSTQVNQLFATLNFTDVYIELVDTLSKLHAALIWENLAFQQGLPEKWNQATDPKPFVMRRVDSNGCVELSSESKSTKSAADGIKPEKIWDEAQPEEGLAVKNARTIRYLLSQTPMGIEAFFHMLGQALAPKRSSEPSTKQHAGAVADQLARALVAEIDYKQFSETDDTMSCKYHSQLMTSTARLLVKHASSLESAYPHKEALSLVLNKFYLNDGFSKLNKCLLSFADIVTKQKQEGQVESVDSSARDGLSTVLLFYNQVVKHKCIIDAVQSTVILVKDHKQPDYFMPAQFLIEVREAVLPTVSEIWNSNAFESMDGNQAKIVVDILQTIFRREGEDRGVLRRADHAVRRMATHKPEFKLRSSQGLAVLVSSGLDEALVREALYRCNNHEAHAREYCNLRKIYLAAPSFPVPESEQPSEQTSEAAKRQSVEMTDVPDAESCELTNTQAHERLETGDDVTLADNTAVSISTAHTVPGTSSQDNEGERPFVVFEDLDERRERLHDSLIERSLEVLSSQPNITWELRDLIRAVVVGRSDDSVSRAEIGSTLVSSLLSLQGDGSGAEAGAKISAYAHLVALVLEDADFFASTVDELKEYFDAMIDWIHLRPDQKAEDAPWIEMILLIIERVLAEDEQPDIVEWDPPESDDPRPHVEQPKNTEVVVSPELRVKLFDALMDLLPKIGKNLSLALSSTRVLVILTRRRQIAQRLCDKQLMHKLFLMVRQLAGSFNDKLRSAFMIILRHLVEDEKILRRVMEKEIRAACENPRSSRHMDTTTYTRNLSHLVLRDSALFVEVTQDLLEITRYDNNPHGAQALALKKPKKASTNQTDAEAEDGSEQATIANSGAADKPVDTKPPTVETTDGVVQFLLRELSNYRDVEDQPVPNRLENRPATANGMPTDVEMTNEQTANGSTAGTGTQVPEKPTYKPEEHVIYKYRCFLMQCLSELLASYSRTKIEFINFSRKPETQPATPSKPRAGTLNYILNVLMPVGTLEHRDDVTHLKKLNTSYAATSVLVTLCSKAQESPSERGGPKNAPNEEDPDLTFVRRFVLEHALRAFKDASTSSEPLDQRYSRLLDLSELFNRMLTNKSNRVSMVDQELVVSEPIARLMLEKNFVTTLTSAIAEIDLNFPNAKRAVKYILGPLKLLTEIGVELSQSSDFAANVNGTVDAEDISSASSLSDDMEEREQTPDLFRNSTLGMFENNQEDYESDESSDEEDEMYSDDYDEEMAYEGDIVAEHGEVVSDDDDEDMEDNEMGDVEGLPGDVGMDIEVVMDDGDEDDLETDPSDMDEMHDEDDEDFDDEMAEITGDDENASLADHVHEDEWEEDDGADYGAEDEQDGGSPHAGPLAALADVIGGDAALIDRGGLVRIDLGHGEEEFFEDEVPPEDEEEEEDEDVEYVNSFVYEPDLEGALHTLRDNLDRFRTWNPEIAARVDAQTEQEHFNWDAPPPPMVRGGHHHHNAHRHHPQGMLDLWNDPTFRPFGGSTFRTHRTMPSARNEDDGSNPLLRREGGQANQGNDRNAGMEHLRTAARTSRGFPREIQHMVQEMGHVGAGSINVTFPPHMVGLGGEPVFHFPARPGATLADLGQRRTIVDPLGGFFPVYRHNEQRTPQWGNDEAASVALNLVSTIGRWQEEARILFNNMHSDKATRVVHALLKLLVPPAIEAKKQHEKAEAERRAAEEKAREERRKKEEAQRAERLAREQKEKEEREAREAEERRLREEAEREAGETATTVGADDEGGDDAAMEEVQPSETTNAPQTTVENEEPPQRIIAVVHGQEFDITTLGIDLSFLEAIPEDMREEVIRAQAAERMPQLAERMHQPALTGNEEEPSEISRDFLDALPPSIQQELLSQEARERRHRANEAERRRAAENGDPEAPLPMEDANADFIAMLDPTLRQAILMDADENTLAALPENIQVEARTLVGDRRLTRIDARMRADMANDRRHRLAAGGPATEEAAKPRRPAMQMLDKAGVATLMRLMFVSMHHKAKSDLHSVLSDVCKNTQGRAEVISMLLSILQDGTGDVHAVERSFAHLSLRAKQSSTPRTPQPLKRTVTGSVGTPGAELSPLNIVQQCLATLKALANGHHRVAAFFLSEHETAYGQKSKLTKKGKERELNAAKYPLNALLMLLDRKIITENTGVMESLAALLARVTLPLNLLSKRKKVAQAGDSAEQGESTDAAPAITDGNAVDVPMAGVPAAEETANGDGEPSASTGAAGQEAKKPDNDASADANSEKKRLEPVPPEVPEENLRLVVNIISARECPSRTFYDTVDLIRNLSLIPGAKETFGKELVRQAQELAQAVAEELAELTEQISGTATDTDLQGVALAKFAPASAKQNKVLRVLLALDYLFDPKRNPQLEEGAEEPQLKVDVLASLYDSPTLDTLWGNLSSCLAAIRKRGNMVNVAATLLPAIESLMVVCRNTTLQDTPLDPVTPLNAPSAPVVGAGMEALFLSFTEDNRKILNELIRNNPKLMNGNLSVMAKNSKVLEFDNKRSYFARKLHNRGSEGRAEHSKPLSVTVDRKEVFHDSYKALWTKRADEIKYGKLNIRFVGEEGIDAGGVSREWFAILAREMFNPNYALFNPVASDRTTFHPNPLSEINELHLKYFKFIGRVIGKALYENRVLDCHFSRAVYRRILGKSVSLKDMESLDLDYYKSLVWILENDITDITFETFSVDVDRFGVTETQDLIENGRNIPVTQNNKHEYVQLIVEHRLVKSIEVQLEHFLTGFHDIISRELIAIFNEQELELLISGLPDIDVDDWKNNTEYHNYQATSPQIQWFWRAVRSFDKEEKAKLLQFITGTSKVPLNGFKELEGMNGFAKFNIHRDYSSKEKLPSSHTCFNQLDLPEYESYEHLRQQLYTAITAGSEYFGFA